AERGHHRPVLDARADDEPVARAPEEQHDRAEHERGRRDRDEPVVGHGRAREVGRALEPRGPGDELRVGAPHALEQRDGREREADGDEHLLDVPLVQRADEQELGERGRGRADHRPGEQREREDAPRVRAERARDEPAAERAEREERAVREVQHAHEPVDERQPGRDEEVQRPEAEPRDEEEDDRAHRDTAPSAVRWSTSACTPSSCWTRSWSSRSARAGPVCTTRPASTTTTRSASRSTTSRFCSTSRIGTVRAASASASATSPTMRGARPLVGSSTRRSRLALSRARASDTICCCPPESVPARCAARCTRSGNSSATSSRRGWASRSASRRFSATVSPANTSRSSGTYPTPRRTIRSVRSPSTRSPASSTSPRRSISPSTALSVDVLPTPLRPRTAVTPVAGTEKVTSSTTC